MNLTEVKNDSRLNNIQKKSSDLQIYPAGMHSVDFLCSLGRGFAEKKKVTMGRVSICQSDIEFLETIPECKFKFSNSGQTLYLINANLLQRDIAQKLIKENKFFNK